MLPNLSKRTFVIGIAVLLLLHLLISIPMASSLNVWTDEASTLYATQNGFWIAFQTAATEQKQAPFYFWIVSIWRTVDSSIFFARLFSILCSVTAIGIFAALARRFFARAGALAVTAFFALHPYLIWASTEIRVYSMVIMLSVLMIYIFFDAFFDERPSNIALRYQLGFLFTAVVSLYTNYYLGFLLVGLFFILAISGRWRQALRYIGLMFIAGAAFLPLVLTALAELQSRSAGSIPNWSAIDGVKMVWSHVVTFLLPTEIYPPETQTLASWIRGWLVRIGIVLTGILAIRNRKNIGLQALAFAIIAMTIGASLVIAGYKVGPSLIIIRHAAVMFAVIVLLYALVLNDVTRNWSAKPRMIAFSAIAAVVIASFGYGITHIYPDGVKRGDWVRVSGFIEQNEQTGQPIVVFPSFDSLSPRYHYRGVNQILPDERYFDYIPGTGIRTSENISEEANFVISEIPKDAEMIWLAVGENCNGNEACSPLQNYIEANYTKEIEKDFYLEKLYLLKKRPN